MNYKDNCSIYSNPANIIDNNDFGQDMINCSKCGRYLIPDTTKDFIGYKGTEDLKIQLFNRITATDGNLKNLIKL